MSFLRVALLVLGISLSPVVAFAASIEEEVKAAYAAWDAFNKSDTNALHHFGRRLDCGSGVAASSQCHQCRCRAIGTQASSGYISRPQNEAKSECLARALSTSSR